MPKSAPQKNEEAKPKKSRAKAPVPKASLLLLSPLTVLIAIGIGAAAGGTCMAVGCFSFLEDTPLPPVPTLPVFSPIAMRTPSPSPSPSEGNGVWGEFVPGPIGLDPVASWGSKPLPTSVDLDVPFTSQAPLGGTWSELHNEACEEASMLMVDAYVKDKGVFAKQATDTAIRDMVAWQSLHGYKVDATAAEMVEIFDRFLSLKARTYNGTEVTVENLKKILAAGHPVIVPVAGKELRNPYFTPPGPDYHVLVLVGYDAEGFIANDPGTRRGAKYRYSTDTILSAIHDWTGNKKTVPQGQRAIVVVEKET